MLLDLVTVFLLNIIVDRFEICNLGQKFRKNCCISGFLLHPFIRDVGSLKQTLVYGCDR